MNPMYKLLDWICEEKLNPNAIPMLEENPEKINWFGICMNHNAIHILDNNPDKIEIGVSVNKNAVHIIERYPERIDWKYLSANENVKALNLLKKNPEKINWVQFSRNPSIFELDFQEMSIARTRVLLEDLMKNILHPSRIQRLIDDYDMDFSDVMEMYIVDDF